jgi:hypothetical protein
MRVKVTMMSEQEMHIKSSISESKSDKLREYRARPWGKLNWFGL